MADNFQAAPKPLCILRRREVESRTGLSCSTIYLRISLGEFPQPISLGGRSVGWLEAEVEQWLADKAAHRTARHR